MKVEEDLNETVSVVTCRRCCMNADWKWSKCFGVALITWENTVSSLCSPKISNVDRRRWMARPDKMRRKRLWEVDGGPGENRTFHSKAQIFFFFFLGQTKQYFALVQVQENNDYSWERKEALAVVVWCSVEQNVNDFIVHPFPHKHL